MARKNGVRIDDSVLKSKIRKMAQRLKVDEKELIRQQGALLAIDLAKYTPPYARFPSGNISKMPVATDADIDMGEHAIAKDCRNVFRAKPEGYIMFCYREFGNSYVNKQMKSASGTKYRIEYRAIGLTVHQMFKFHEMMVRPSSGRTGYKQDIQSMWVPEDLFEEYVEWRTRNIGLAKATLLMSAKKINPKARFKVTPKVRKMIKKARGGRGRVASTSKGPVALVKARAAGLQHTQRQIPRVIKGRITAMTSRVKAIARANAKKSGFKVK